MQGDDPRYTIAKAIYGAALEQDRKMSSREWVCGYCTERWTIPDTLAGIRDHLRTAQVFRLFDRTLHSYLHITDRHQIENPVEHRDFFFYFDQESLPTRTYFFHTSPMLRRKSEYVEVMDLIKRGLAAVIDLSNMIEH